MGNCRSSKDATSIAMPEPYMAAILIVCHRDGDAVGDSGGGYVKYRHRTSVADAVKEFSNDYCICSWESIHVGQRPTRLKPWQFLELGEVYFLLPCRRLRFQVTLEDLSVLFSKAASSLKSFPSCPIKLSSSEHCYHDELHQHALTDFEHDEGMSGFAAEEEKVGLAKHREKLRVLQNHQKQRFRKQSRWKSQLSSGLETIMEVV